MPLEVKDIENEKVKLYAMNRKERRAKMKELGLTKVHVPPFTMKQSEEITKTIQAQTMQDSKAYWDYMEKKKRGTLNKQA